MTIDKTLIKATAETYTRAELLAKRKEALDKLADMEMITSASTGAGASYTMAERAKAEEMIALYSAAIDYLDGVDYTGAEVYNIRFI